MKNISKAIVKGVEYWCVSVTIEKNKRKRKFFKSQNDAKNWLREFKRVDKNNANEILNLSKEQMADIKEALKKLPQNTTLLDCVNAYNRKIIKIELSKAIDEFLKNKEKAVTNHYYADIKNQLTKFNLKFKDWEDVTASELVKWCKSISNATKTQKHYFSTTKEFYTFAETKRYTENIFKEIHKSEIPKVQRNQIKISSVETIQEFFKRLEEKKPQLASLFALVAFGGFRLAEAQRLEEKSFNYENKEILLNFKDSKTGQTWLQSNMPANVWKWLEKYPPCEKWKTRNLDLHLKDVKKGLNLAPNALRHAFATYHLSTNRKVEETQILMRHTSSAMLWQTYLAGLTDKETAKAYFAIVPKETKQEAESLVAGDGL